MQHSATSGTTTRPYIIAGIFISLTGAICFSTKAIFVKLAYRQEHVEAVTLLALRMLFSLPFFVVSAYASSARENNVRFTGKQWAGVALVGCLGYYISSLLDFLGLQYISAGIERLVLFIYPTFVLLMSAVIFRVKVKQYQWLALAITYAGLLIAFWSEANLVTDTVNFYKGSALIFACAITYALYIVGSGRLIPLVGAAKFNSYAMSFASAAVILHFLIAGNQSLFGLSWTTYVYSFLMAVIGTIIPSFLVTEGIKRIGSDNAAIVGSIGPVSTILQAYFFLGESIHMLQLVGTALIVVGILVIGKKSK
jgi:drug/metabolite transporter (DMT)-like permease